MHAEADRASLTLFFWPPQITCPTSNRYSVSSHAFPSTKVRWSTVVGLRVFASLTNRSRFPACLLRCRRCPILFEHSGLRRTPNTGALLSSVKIRFEHFNFQLMHTMCKVHTPHRSQYAAITLTTSCTASTYLLLTKCVIFS